ncbi:MAG: TATA-box-binding protein [Candidatus Lokiarchaeota archaeon]|nr:TATA-box-binding protein [Candidatus Lokiarchaeota archaeon]
MELSNSDEKIKGAFQITNIVSSVSLKTHIDLDLLAEKYQEVEYNVNNFPGVRIRFSKPKCTALLYENGEMIITGIKKTEFIPVIISKVINNLKINNIVVPEKPSCRIVNMAVSGHLKKRIDLDLASVVLERTIYEPEVFPGLVLRIDDPHKCVFLCFSNGKFVVTGLIKKDQIKESVISFGNLIKNNDLFLLDDE